jgi:cysteine desulfurase
MDSSAKVIYFDNAASTPPHPEVVEAMLPFLREQFGNPSSIHEFGTAPKKGGKEARENIGELIGANPDEIIFTASGTEANNIALKGVAEARKKKGRHIISTSIEHYSVLHPLKTLSRAGFEITQLPVDRYGTINPEQVAEAIREDTILISIMHANNEVGTIQPIKEIGQLARERGIYFHTDAVMSAGRIPVDVETDNIDLLSLAANQFYGPQGVGGLYIRKGVRLLPLIEGGTQQGGKRAGTENVAGIVGMGTAAKIARTKKEEYNSRLEVLQKSLWEELPRRIDYLYLTGHPQNRIPGHVSFCVEFIEGEGMLLSLMMEGFAVASGSACTSLALKSSHVLQAMGIDAALAQGSMVLTLGKDNTEEEVNRFVEVLPPIIDRLRQMSPLYEKIKSKSDSPTH